MASGLERVKCGDKNYEQTLQKWFDEPSDEEQNDSSEVENSNDEMFKEDQIIEDDCSSTSEQEYFPSDHEEDSNLEVEAVDDSNSSGDNVQSDHVTGVVSYKVKMAMFGSPNPIKL
ncbi:hypothetical protein RI129_002992 [Pyrocoelia pectoralis]|uniref:Uncharacterized protein n=1 Tax=Pyrocoelia pectoralis TaxID=417401 RepID=A0AAN7VG85_9COLE